MRALVIDDARTVRIIIGQILREIGIEVLEAKNGVEGLEQLRKNPDIDLMLVDWNMPEMNGFDFVVAVRAQRDCDRIRILMVTSESQGVNVSQALRAGANDYLMKPFNRDVLLAKLQLLDVPQE
jgi:two-component system, chemotaxis family, chemotaxis protein CheY